eukprot:985959_1
MPSSSSISISYVLRYPSREPTHLSRPSHCSSVSRLTIARESVNDIFLYSCGQDATVRKWKINDGKTASHEQVLSGHTDWVTDLILLNDDKLALTSSTDTFLKLWNLSNGDCVQTIERHSDFIECLAYSGHTQTVASAGLDNQVFLWDVEDIGRPKANLTRDSRVDVGSVYCIAMNPKGSILVSGSTDKAVRVWDPRTGKLAFSAMRGAHRENIRAIAINEDGTMCVSAGTDNRLNLWDIGQQRCVATYFPSSHSGQSPHSGHQSRDTQWAGSIWTLAVDSGFRDVYTAGGRGKGRGEVWVTNLAAGESRSLGQFSSEPILGICLDETQNSLWVGASQSSSTSCFDLSDTDSCKSATNPSVSCMSETSHPISYKSETTHSVSFKSETTHSISCKSETNHSMSRSNGIDSSCTKDQSQPIMNGISHKPSKRLPRSPLIRIEGVSPIFRVAVLSDGFHILSLDRSGSVVLWDVIKGIVVRDYGTKEQFDDVFKSLQLIKSVPSWFSVSLRLGTICIKLEERTCFNGVTRDPRLDPDGSVCLGQLALRSIFSGFLQYSIANHERWEREYAEWKDRKLSSVSEHTTHTHSTSSPTRPARLPDMSWVDTTSSSAPKGITIILGQSRFREIRTPILLFQRFHHNFQNFSRDALLERFEDAKVIRGRHNRLDPEGRLPTASQRNLRDLIPDSGPLVVERTNATVGAVRGLRREPSHGRSRSQGGSKLPVGPSRPAMTRTVSTPNTKLVFGVKRGEASGEDESPSPSATEQNSLDEVANGEIISTNSEPPTGNNIVGRLVKPEVFRSQSTISQPSSAADRPPVTGARSSRASFGSQHESYKKLIPEWARDAILDDRRPPCTLPKIRFDVLPREPDILPEIKSSARLLSADPSLQVTQILDYVFKALTEQFKYEWDSPNGEPVESELVLAIFCDDEELSPEMDLQTVRDFIKPSGMSLALQYKLKRAPNDIS